MSQITTHVLDTSLGKTAAGIRVKLFFWKNNAWDTIASGITNKDGRITDLLKSGGLLDKGILENEF